MKNILATSDQILRKHGLALLFGASFIAQTLWGVWATRQIQTLESREVVTVQLARMMGDFVAAEARAGRPPEATQARIQTYLKAVEASVAKLGREGRTVLVAEAVVAGAAPDLTATVEADVARRMQGPANAVR
jgi:hypothetical protein